MNRKDLALALGISASMVSRLAKRGMPTDNVERAQRWRKRHLEPGRRKDVRMPPGGQPAATALPGEHQPSDLIAAAAGTPDAAAGDHEDDAAADATAGAGERQQDDPRYMESRSSREEAAARREWLKLKEEEGELVRIDQVRAALAARLAPVREGLMQIPARLAPVLAAQSDPARIQNQLEEEIHKVLEPLGSRSTPADHAKA